MFGIRKKISFVCSLFGKQGRKIGFIVRTVKNGDTRIVSISPGVLTIIFVISGNYIKNYVNLRRTRNKKNKIYIFSFI